MNKIILPICPLKGFKCPFYNPQKRTCNGNAYKCEFFTPIDKVTECSLEDEQRNFNEYKKEREMNNNE